MHLRADRMVARGLVAAISDVPVRVTLNKEASNRG